MAGLGPLYETNKLAVLTQLHAVRRANGHCVAGVLSEAIMAAVCEFVRETQGPEAAFNVLTRHADAVIEPVIERGRTHPQQHQSGDER